MTERCKSYSGNQNLRIVKPFIDKADCFLNQGKYIKTSLVNAIRNHYDFGMEKPDKMSDVDSEVLEILSDCDMSERRQEFERIIEKTEEMLAGSQYLKDLEDCGATIIKPRNLSNTVE